jgi:hypothetical protein
MPKVKDILTEQESLEIARLRLLNLQSNSITKSLKYKKQVKKIINNAIARHRANNGKNDSYA